MGVTGWILRANRHDERLLHALVIRRRSALDRAMGALTHLGDPLFVVPLVLLLAFGSLPGMAEAGRAALFALVTSHTVVQLLKRTVVRPRPRLPYGVAALVRAPDRFSFPSGHSAAAMSVAVPLIAAASLAAAVTVLGLAVLVGVSRSYLGVHYPGDVVVGWLLGAGAALAAGPALAMVASGLP